MEVYGLEVVGEVGVVQIVLLGVVVYTAVLSSQWLPVVDGQYHLVFYSTFIVSCLWLT